MFKRIVCLSLLLFLVNQAFSQIVPRLIVRADDMGAFHSVNVATVEGYENGIETCIEVMVVTPWFPEAVRMLKEVPTVDVGLHLTITSEWDNFKWRPLTQCPSLTDKDGYFLPMISPNPAYPGLAITENNWQIDEIEQEFRAQIELALKHLPRISHLSGHMGATGFHEDVVRLVRRLAEEYDLPAIDRVDAMQQYNFIYVGYDGPGITAAEKEASFLSMLNKLEPGRNYMFLDHPALDNEEMQTVGHVGYEDVATDRQGVTDLFTSPRVKEAIQQKGIRLISYNDLTKPLPRATEPGRKITHAFDNYLKAVNAAGQDLHSIMVLQHGEVVAETWLGDHTPEQPHILNSVSKSFTATAIGLAVAEGRLRVTDKVISFFPDKLPAQVSDKLAAMEVKDLLTMSTGHAVEPRPGKETENWIEYFLSAPVEYTPGTHFLYNSYATYMLSAILHTLTGERLIDYLYPRLFRPLGIVGADWQQSPEGIDLGGWGLYVKTEDMAKFGQLFLQKGEWKGKQILPREWVEAASSYQVASLPAGVKKEDLKEKGLNSKNSDWLQGYGYQMWRCRHNAYRADGAHGQYIIVIPEKDAVIVTTARIDDMQAELNLIWKYLLPVL